MLLNNVKLGIKLYHLPEWSIMYNWSMSHKKPKIEKKMQQLTSVGTLFAQGIWQFMQQM